MTESKRESERASKKEQEKEQEREHSGGAPITCPAHRPMFSEDRAGIGLVVCPV